MKFTVNGSFVITEVKKFGKHKESLGGELGFIVSQ
jgi:hypothetical protein